MRTTVDLPDDLHELARQLAHDGDRSVSEVIAELIRQGLRREPQEMASSPRGMPLLSVGRTITPEDVRSLEDED